jgi:tRNA (guanine37-N1)-methyltransferase
MSEIDEVDKNQKQYYIMIPSAKVQNFREILQSTVASKLGIQKNEDYEFYKDSKERKQNNSGQDLNIGIPITLTDISTNISYLLSELSNLLEIPQFTITIFPITGEFDKFRKLDIPGNLKDILSSEFPEDVVKFVSRSFDIVGSIAIMEIDRWDDLHDILQSNQTLKDFNIQDLKKKIGKVLLQHYKGIKTVINKVGEVSGEFRVRQYEYLAGLNDFTTIHRENNCAFELDISKVFFTPRLVYERQRVSSIPFGSSQIILDCFSGVGPFSIEIACNNNTTIISCEKNPEAFSYLEKNIQLNRKRMKGKIQTYKGDFRDLKDSNLGKKYQKSVDYIVMNLPELNLEFIGDIKYYIKNGTYLILYLFAPTPEPLETGLQAILAKFNEQKIKISSVEGKRIVKNYSPHMFMIVFDLRLELEEQCSNKDI